jgi:MFS family permease
VPPRALGRTIAEGLRYVWASRTLRLLAAVNMAHRMCLAPLQLAVIVFAREQLQADAPAIGLLFSASGAGGLLAAAITPRLRARLPVGRLMLALVAATGLGLSVIGSATALWLVMLGLLITGMMDTMSSITQVSYRLAIIPDGLQGRVNSVYRLLSFSAMSFGTAAGGILLGLIGPRSVLWLLAAVVGAIALLAALAGLHRLDD